MWIAFLIEFYTLSIHEYLAFGCKCLFASLMSAGRAAIFRVLINVASFDSCLPTIMHMLGLGICWNILIGIL